jgi:adenylate cyclase class IV
MSNKEYEVRISNIDTTEFRKKLKKIGAKLDNPKQLMPSVVFTHPKNKKDSYVRIRNEGKQITMTSKSNLKNKFVTEYEVEIDDFQSGVDLLLSLGCKIKYYAEKIRETWKVPGCKEIVFDSYPGLKEYIEIECNSEKILNFTMKKLDVKPDNSDISIDGMYLNQYGIKKDRKKSERFTFKDSKKNLSKFITKNKSTFNKIIKEQLDFLNKK